MTSENGDSPELEALFDSIVDSMEATQQPPIEGESRVVRDEGEAAIPRTGGTAPELYESIGVLTRKLHDTLRELGYDKSLQDAAEAMPDTRERLNYIATMTEKAAVRTLNAVDQAKPLQDTLGGDAQALAKRWQAVFANQVGVDEFRELAGKTKDFLEGVPAKTEATNTQLMEIMMAQDFQDLTGQVIKKVSSLAQDLERQLLDILVASTPTEKKQHLSDSLLNGPVVNAEGRSDVVTSQEQVDELLASLGF